MHTNKALSTLNLHENYVGAAGTHYLAEALIVNTVRNTFAALDASLEVMPIADTHHAKAGKKSDR